MKYTLLLLLFVGCSTPTEPEKDKWVFKGTAYYDGGFDVACENVTVTLQIIDLYGYGEVKGSCIWDSISFGGYVESYTDLFKAYRQYWHVPNGKKKDAAYRIAWYGMDSIEFLGDSIWVRAYRQ